MEHEINNSSNSSKVGPALWITAIIFVGLASFFIGRSTSSKPSQEVAGVNVTQPTLIPTSTPPPPTSSEIANPTPTVDLESICSKSGPSQKKDYLVSYILKSGDNIQSIAENQLGDSTRVSELTALNDDQTNLTVGSTLYLPPPSIKSSSGHILEVSGKIVKKDNGSWQISYGGGANGPGLLIPGYYLKDIPNLDSYHIGDCVTILLDNGVKAYSLRKSQ